MSDVRLPITASPAELVEGIERAQARCREHLLDVTATVTDIIVQLGRVNDMAAAVGVTFEDLHPRAHWFPRYHPIGNPVTTVISMDERGYWIRRATPVVTMSPGWVSLSLRPPRGVSRG